MTATTSLPILHFNDVYRVQPQKLPSSTKKVSASQFTENLHKLRNAWPDSKDAPGAKDGLVLFSGDLFSPSLESTVTRGSHMVCRCLSFWATSCSTAQVPAINIIAPDVALTGNHDFDFGYPHLTTLVQDCKFPWLLSNIIDTNTGQTPEHLHKFCVTRRSGVTIGIIGLVEEEWLQTVSSWPPNFAFQPMDQVGMELSKLLRSEPYNCDLILALTHSRLPNDITLSHQLGAKRNPDPTRHGVDMLFGGHDHMYYIGHGIDKWDGWDFSHVVLGAKGDTDTLLVKSGTDFRDLSDLTLELADAPPGSIRKKLIKSVSGRKHVTAPDWPDCPKFDTMLKSVLGEVQSSLSKPICRTLTKWDVRSEHVRTTESAIGNWMADILRHAYDDAVCVRGRTEAAGADAVLICGGTLRGDSTYGPGYITLGDVYEILPFDDPIIMLQLTGEDIWNALENGFSTWPAQEGRFPIVGGMRVRWDSRKPPNQRVLSVHLAEGLHEIDEVKCDQSRTYAVVSRQYMAEGFDGFEALKDKPFLIDDESGVVMSSIIRKFLLGTQYIQFFQQSPNIDLEHFDPRTPTILGDARQSYLDDPQSPELLPSPLLARKEIKDALRVGGSEHMSVVDIHDGQRMRTGKESRFAHLQAGSPISPERKELPIVAPMIDERLLDMGRL
ncbi:Metallo-dependent phosphatase [Calocera cornea HHB12733]|uniref:Metallo-dependent phosphatase n=1 Tax=Calocera cornea HHB12733 TaxID=1353952 RepID=A0A165J184_9BASI|nr:Metallo-dependent phosphatase [Calocera cornea HHB12733]